MIGDRHFDFAEDADAAFVPNDMGFAARFNRTEDDGRGAKCFASRVVAGNRRFFVAARDHLHFGVGEVAAVGVEIEVFGVHNRRSDGFEDLRRLRVDFIAQDVEFHDGNGIGPCIGRSEEARTS